MQDDFVGAYAAQDIAGLAVEKIEVKISLGQPLAHPMPREMQSESPIVGTILSVGG